MSMKADPPSMDDTAKEATFKKIVALEKAIVLPSRLDTSTGKIAFNN